MADADADMVLQLELALLKPATRADRAALERPLAAEFVEIGSSGERLERHAVIAGLMAERAEPVLARDVDQLRVDTVTADVLLVTYRVRRSKLDGVETFRWRSPGWRRQVEQWQMVFHQGTPVPHRCK